VDCKLKKIKIQPCEGQACGIRMFVDEEELGYGTLEADLRIKGGEKPQLTLKQHVKVDSIELNAEVKEIKVNEMNFGEALEQLKQGNKVTRSGWNGKEMYVTKIPAGNAMYQGYDMQDCFGLKTANNLMQPGWLPSQNDLFAEDWNVIDKRTRVKTYKSMYER